MKFLFKKGHKINLGRKPSLESRIKMSIARTGKKISPHKRRKKHNIGYRALHYRIQSSLGRATKCDHCGKEWDRPRSIHWANKSHRYLKILSDWIQLCVSCHKKYDSKNSNHRRPRKNHQRGTH